MEQPRRPKKQSIDALNEKLYHRGVEFENKTRRPIHGKKIELDHDFDDTELDALIKEKPKFKLPKSLFKRFFIGAIIFFIGAAILAFFSLVNSSRTVSKDLISMEILAQPLVDGGEMLELQVRIQNFNDKVLELPDLVLSYKKDSYIDGNEVFLRRSLDDILPENQMSEEFNIQLFGQEGDVREINATLEYRIPGSSSIFVKEVNHEVVIRSTPTRLAINAPENLTKNQEVSIDFAIASNTTDQVANGLLKIEYPEGFEFISSNIEPSYGNNTWEIKTLDNNGQVINVSGRLAALEGQGQTIKAVFGKQNVLARKELETIFNTAAHTVNIQRPFLDTFLEINNKEESLVAVRSGGRINGEISFINTLGERLKDISLTLHLKGSLYEEKNVLSFTGFYDSNTDTIVWDQNSVESFSFVEPGEEGSVSFTLQVPDLIDVESIVDPSLQMSVDVRAVQNDGTVLFAKSIARSEVRTNSDLKVLAKTIHYSGPFSNIGPVPPQVGKETQYTITLDLVNSSNDVKNAKLITSLPPYVDWTGSVHPSGERSKVSYNNATREIIWNIGTLNRGLGIGDQAPKKISFQVTVLPSVSQLDIAPDITNDIILSGTDSFTDVELNFTKKPLTTRLLNDTSDIGADGKVVE